MNGDEEQAKPSETGGGPTSGEKVTRKPRRVRLRSIRVVAIDPAKYPQFCKDPDNPYSSQPDDVRWAEIEDICAHVLFQCMLERSAALAKTSVAA